MCEIGRGRVINKKEIESNFGEYPVYSSQTSNDGIFGYLNTFDFEGEYATWTTDGIYAGSVFYRNGKFNCTNVCGTLKAKTDKIDMKFLSFVLPLFTQDYVVRVANPKLMNNVMAQIKIPLPPKEIQEKIVSEIEVLEKKEGEAKEKIEKYNAQIYDIINNVKGENKKLRELCNYSDNRINNTLLTSKNYIGVDNMLQNTKGKVDSNFVPNSGTSTAYNVGDILLSNIRPYLKKIWYADNNGGSSNDVLVLQTSIENVDSRYLFYHLKQDKFFDYEMEGKKGVKMPRGDKQHILDYPISVPPLPEQQKIVSEIEKVELEIASLEQQLVEIPKEKENVLKKYL